MSKTLAQVDLQVRELIGDYQRTNFSSAQVTEAVNWAQDLVIRRKGFKRATRLYSMDGYPTGPLPPELLAVKRVQLVQVSPAAVPQFMSVLAWDGLTPLLVPPIVGDMAVPALPLRGYTYTEMPEFKFIIGICNMPVTWSISHETVQPRMPAAPFENVGSAMPVESLVSIASQNGLTSITLALATSPGFELVDYYFDFTLNAGVNSVRIRLFHLGV